MSQPFDSIRSPHRSLDASSLLEQPTSVLLGIPQPAADALGAVGVATVFDLASSGVFANAVDICLLAQGRQGRFAVTGRVPHDALRSGYDHPLGELPLQPVGILGTEASRTKMDALAVALDVATIRDLAAWPPYRTARELLDRVYNPLAVTGAADPEAPADLVPSNGQYPTERVQYEVLLFDAFAGPEKTPSLSHFRDSGLRPLGAGGPIDVSQLLAANEGYDRPAIGGVLTFTQSWYTKGLSLGHLIHGIALAPGESTKIAMIDWTRRVRTSATESIEEGEQLDADLSRARSISEITSAVARETQSGSSGAHSASVATQFGRATGSAGVRSPFDPTSFLGTAAGVETSGTSFGVSTGVTGATSWSTSSGQRDVGASLAQDIVDRTHQASHSARNRRASIVREVSQTESESISTRTLTNYNHMHALTVEYYEVVQLYRTVVELSKADRCLFVPMKLVNFHDPAVRGRFRHVIAAAGLIPQVRALAFMEPDQVAFGAPLRAGAWSDRDLGELAGALKRPVGQGDSPYLTLPMDFAENFNFGFDGDAPIEQAIVTFAAGNALTFGIVNRAEGSNYWTAQFGAATGDTFNVAKQGYDFSDVRRIELVKRESAADYAGPLSITLSFVNREAMFALDAPAVAMHASITVPKGAGRFTMLDVTEAFGDADLAKHLLANQLYYSQAIWRALDPATIGILLSGYTWPVSGQVKSLVEIVDPTPVAIVANYLALRISGDDAAEHAAWLTRKKIEVGSRREDQVPVPSGGVFAEAVLGRFNAAEKLDLTRFWNWQDSPIPIQAPDIAAIQAGSRRDPDSTVPGQLGAPVLNIVNSPAMPDPQGMGAVLAAIQNGNMFRDMSGLAATVGLAQAGLAGAQQGATDAAAQAGRNAEVAAQFGAKLAELAAQIVGARMTGGASAAGGGLINSETGTSKAGAMLNYARDMDRRAVARPSEVAAGSGEDAGEPRAGSAAAATAAGSWEGDAVETATGGIPSGMLGNMLALLTGASPLNGGTAGAAGKTSYWSRPAVKREVIIGSPDDASGEIETHGFDFEPTGAGASGTINGPLTHNGTYKIVKNEPGLLEMDVSIGTDELQTNDMNVKLVVRDGAVKLTGTLNAKSLEAGLTAQVKGAGTRASPFKIEFKLGSLEWF